MYWLFILLAFLISLPAITLLAHSQGMTLHEFSLQITGAGVRSSAGRRAILSMIPLWILISVSGLAVHIKRLHDRNRSGWWLLFFVYGPWLITFTINAIGDPLTKFYWLHLSYTLLINAISLWGLLEFGILRGTVSDNRFGPDPLGKND